MRPGRIARTFPRLAILAVAALAPAHDAPGAGEIPVAEPTRSTPIDFAAEVAPIFRANCLACHNEDDPGGDLSLESPESILRGGTHGPAIVPGDGNASRLLRSAAHRAKPAMPPRDNKVGATPLTPDQLGLLRLWIDQGAKGKVESRPGPVAWQPPAPGFHPIYALAVSPDGRFAACSRADQIIIYDLPAARPVARLIDPAEPGRAHVDSVRSLAFSPDGATLASGGFRTIKLWRRPRIARESSFTPGAVAAVVAISPSGTVAAFGLPGGRIAIHELPSGKRVREIAAGAEDSPAPRALGLSADGSRLYASTANAVEVWSIADGSRLGSLPAPSPVRSLAVLDRAGKLVTGHEDGQLRAWDVSGPPGDPKPLAAIPAHSGAITALASWPSAPAEVASAGEDGWLRRWDVAGANRLREFQHGAPIAALAASPDGSRFASVGGPVARLWDAANGALVAECKGDLRAQRKLRQAETTVRFASADLDYRTRELQEAKSRVDELTRAHESARKLLEPAEKALAEKREAARKPQADAVAATEAAKTTAVERERAVASKKAAEVALSRARDAVGPARGVAGRARAAAAKEPDKADLASAAEAAEKAAADAATSLKTAEEAIKAAAQADQAAERKARAATEAERQAREKLREAEERVKEAETAREVAEFSIKTSRQVLDRDQLLVAPAKEAVASARSAVVKAQEAKKAAEADAQAPGRPWRSVAFSADGAWLVAGDEAGALHAFDGERGLPAEVLDEAPGPILALSTGADGAIVSLSASGQAAVYRGVGSWSLARVIGRVDDPSTLADRVLGLDFQPGGTLLASAGGEAGRSGELKVWDVAEGRLVRDYGKVHDDAIFAVRFAPGGGSIATASADRSVKILPTTGDAPARTLAGHAHHARGVAWRADGRVLASAGADAVIKFWDPDLGLLLRTETGDVNRTRDYRREVTSLAFLGSSDLALAASGDGTIRLHRAGSPHFTRIYANPGAFAYCAAATPDGKWVLAGGHDGVLRLWDGEATNLLREFTP